MTCGKFEAKHLAAASTSYVEGFGRRKWTSKYEGMEKLQSKTARNC